MLLNEALEIVGSLSEPSKMPGYAWGISARLCKTGSKLREVEGSVCSKCYALKGNYVFPVVKNAQAKRLEGLSHPKWVEAMTIVIDNYEKSGYFRLMDAGDIQSLEMLEKICEVVNNLPKIRFWLPTKEYSIVKEYVDKYGKLPKNLIIRLSAYMIDGQAPIKLAKKYGAFTSGVSKSNYNCPASNQGNKCLDCRKCWDKRVQVVNYKYH